MILRVGQRATRRRVRIAILAMAILGLGAVLCAPVCSAARAIVHTTQVADVVVPSTVSSNWSGYAVTGPAGTPISYSSITGTWTAPAVRCTSADAGASSSVWIGLGGYNEDSHALEQIGTEADCDASGTAAYYAFYELVPDDAVDLKAKVRPGDTITTSVSILDATHVWLRMRNWTRNWIMSTKIRFPHPDRTSAEWIAEAPCTGTVQQCHALPLANFGSVRIRKLAATGDGVSGTLTNPAWKVAPLQLVPHASRHFQFLYVKRFRSFIGSTAGATPGRFSADGTAFRIVWGPRAATLTSH
jgi:hypothetical protein